MKLIMKLLPVLAISGLLCGCNFLGGTATGAGAAGAGYELKARQQIEKLDEDLKRGRIDQKEYDIRKDQIQRGSLVY